MPRKKNRESAFAHRLAAFRKARGLTQVQLSERTGVSQRAIASYESQGVVPPATIVVSLARGLGTTADELLGLKAPPRALRRITPTPPWLRRRVQQLVALPERDRRAVFRLLNALIAARTNGGR